MREAASWIEGKLQRVVWVSAKSAYAVVVLDVDGEPITAVGDLALLTEQEEGSFVALEGRWEEHPSHGRQFRSNGFLQGTPRTTTGLILYLGSAGIPGVGPKLAERIVSKFGMKTLDILGHSPEQLRTVSGIGAKRAEVIQERWVSDTQGRAIAITLRGLGLSNRLVGKIRRRYGEKTAQVVTRHPYRLAEDIRGIGFRTADQLALAQGIPEDDIQRVRAAVLYTLQRATSDGHCFLRSEELEVRVQALGVPTSSLQEAVEIAVNDGAVVVETEPELRIWPVDLFEAEMFVARELLERVQLQPNLSFSPTDTITGAERAEGIDLDDSQRRAVEAALGGGVVVVTGGPGTGKTTLLRVLLRAAGADDWLLASPTGRAAKRLQEATGRPASTLHRLLEYNPGEGGFKRNATNPLEGCGLIVDEVSMVDLELMRALLEALPYPAPEFSLVLVGDSDQLPSVGPGKILADIIRSKRVPCVRLAHVHRQSKTSGIIVAAHQVRQGDIPAQGPPGGDFFLIHRESTDDLRRTLVKVLHERLPAKGFPSNQVQVLTPTRKGPLGTYEINTLLQRHINRDGAVVHEGKGGLLREGDRVICTRNRYDVEVFNGDLGEVLSRGASGILIRFDDRRVTWPFDELRSIELAYSITVHKSQGSEYPAVVLLLHPSHGIMLQRKLFYTALTRAKKFLVVLGAPRGWARAVRSSSLHDRNTALSARLLT